jgi:type II secretory pathway predicted ATPase ExeA
MYEAFYGLREKPFSSLPDPDFLYWSPAYRMAYGLLESGVRNAAELIVLTGEVGCGKTTLIRHLIGRASEKAAVGLIHNNPQSQDELLRCIMHSLNLPFLDDFTQLFKAFRDFLSQQEEIGKRTTLIFDDAQNLQFERYRDLRLFCNAGATRSVLQLVLVGEPQLREMLHLPQLAPYAQPDMPRFHLEPLSPGEVKQYISSRLSAAGAAQQLFTSQACNLIAHASGGVPRVINILCDTALVYGLGTKAAMISGELVRQMIEDKEPSGILPLARAYHPGASTTLRDFSRSFTG